MQGRESVRIDKWLWAVRLYRTRSLATEACRGGHVEVGGTKVKPAREIRIGETIVTRIGDVTRTTRVLGLIERRVGAPAVKSFAEDLTPPEEYQRHRKPDFQPVALRPKGTGRPTKKERRQMEKLW